MMASGESDVLIYPEGVPGIAKGFNNKYQLQRFSSSFVRMAIKHQTDIIPISTVNAEYINPWTYASMTVNRLMNKISIPFLPLGPILLPLLFFPWMFYFGFPAKLTYVVGRRIKPHEWVSKPFEEITLDEFRAIAEKVRGLMQEDLDAAVQKYGQTLQANGINQESSEDTLFNLANFASFGHPFSMSEPTTKIRVRRPI